MLLQVLSLHANLCPESEGRRQKCSMLARISSADFVLMNGLGASLLMAKLLDGGLERRRVA